MRKFEHTDGNIYGVKGDELCCFELAEGKAVAEIPAYVKQIGGGTPGVFEGCESLKQVKIAGRLERIGRAAFGACTTLKDFPFLDSLEEIDAYAFAGSGLEKASLPDSVQNIGEAAFSCCNELTCAKLPSGMREIPPGMFQNCRKLETVVIPDCTHVISESAFYHCELLRDVKLPAQLHSVGEYAFYCCSQITELQLPKMLTSIGSCTFEGLHYIKEIDIHDSSICMDSGLLGIGGIFARCDQLKTVTLPGDASWRLVEGCHWNVEGMPAFDCQVIYRPLSFLSETNMVYAYDRYANFNQAEKRFVKEILYCINRILSDLAFPIELLTIILVNSGKTFIPQRNMEIKAPAEPIGNIEYNVTKARCVKGEVAACQQL
jgi:hypothetical protein